MTHSHTPSSLHLPHDGKPPALIHLDDFCYAYDDVAALRHVDLRICAGDAVVLMGDNGSGKSTLLKALVGLIHPQRGTYRFDGQVVDEASMRDPSFSKRLHQRVGFIFQDSDAQLFCASVEDEVAFGPRQMGLSPDEVSRRVDDTLRLLGIETLRGRAPYNLSGGEKKRVVGREDPDHRHARPVACRRTGRLVRVRGRLPWLRGPSPRAHQRLRKAGLVLGAALTTGCVRDRGHVPRCRRWPW